METIDNLKRINIFSFLEENILLKLAKICGVKTYQAGEYVFREGEKGKGFFGIAKGKVKIYKSNLEGKEHILHVLGEGDIFAEVVLGGDYNYPANSVCLEESKLIFIPKDKFKKLFKEEPDLALKLIYFFSLRLKELVHKVEVLSLKEVPQRLALYLYSLSKKQDKDELDLEINKSMLAYLLGTIPETLSRSFKKLKELNLIELSNKRVKILDIQALKQFAQGSASF